MEFTEDVINELKSFFLSDTLAQEEINHYLKKLLIDYFRLSNVSKTLHYKILSLLIYNYMVGIEDMSIAYIKKKFGVWGKKFNNVLRMLRAVGLINQNGGVIALTTHIINNIFNLIYQMQNSNKINEDFIYELEKKNIRLSYLKKLAREYLKDKNYLSYFEKDFIAKLFNLYVEKANSLKLLFIKKDAVKIKKDCKIKELEYLQKEDLLILDYKTRFNNYSILKRKIKELEEIIKSGAKNYPYALFITLTVDIKNFKSILESSKKISRAFNNFMSALSRKLGYRPKYIAVREFHKNGNPHIHLLIFVNEIKKKNGEWIISQNWIKERWKNYNIGEIVYIYALKSSKDKKTYMWLNGYPKGTKSNNIASYLSKYLRKAFNDDLELSLFWVSNLRFYTYSRDLKEEKQKEIKIKKWEFLGAIDVNKYKNVEELVKELRDKYIKRRDNYIYMYSYNNYNEGIIW